MKNLLLTIAMLLCSITVFSQWTISTDGRVDYEFNSEVEDFVRVEDSYQNVVTFFEINDDQTYMKHTTPTAVSIYMLNIAKVSKEDEPAAIHYNAISDNGYEYYILLNLGHDEIKFLYDWEDDVIMTVFFIKNRWHQK
jgi:hypothetical protein